MDKAVTLTERELELLEAILTDGGDKDMLYQYWKDSRNDEDLEQQEVYGFQDINEVYFLHDSIMVKLFGYKR